jgi:phosphohistidine phosphatase
MVRARMAQQLWLLRHGEAEPHDARPDDERRLTARGEDQSRSAGRAFKALELTFHLVFTSPKVRALDTARLACEACSCDYVVHEPLSAGFDARQALDLAAMAGPDQRVLIVGHNPDFVQIVVDLTGGRVELKKGGVAGIRLRGGGGELIALLRPRELDRL